MPVLLTLQISLPRVTFSPVLVQVLTQPSQLASMVTYSLPVALLLTVFVGLLLPQLVFPALVSLEKVVWLPEPLQVLLSDSVLAQMVKFLLPTLRVLLV
jgi:hypothetical protein